MTESMFAESAGSTREFLAHQVMDAGVVAMSLKGVRLDDCRVVAPTFEFGPFSYGKILGPTE